MDEALRALQSILGAEHLVTGERRVEEVNRDTLPSVVAPLAYAYPRDVPSVKAVVDWARAHAIPLWPSGQGRNWAYGAATPLAQRSVVLMLKHLNRIEHVDPDLAYAVIEPGVSYRQLFEHLRQKHPHLWIDATDGTPGGSVLGNALERGVGPTPYGDHYAQLCGLEVLLPNGEVIQTGGMKDSRSFNTYRWGSGPIVDGLFSQSNLGIVLKAGIWLMPRPQAYRTMIFEMSDDASLSDVLRTLQDLFIEGLLRGAVRFVNEMVSISLFAQYPNPPGQCMSAAQIERLRRRLGLARWTLSAGLYGSKSAVSSSARAIRRRLSPHGRLMFLDDRAVRWIERISSHAAHQDPRGAYGAGLRRILPALAGKPLNVVESIPTLHRLLQGEPTEFFVRHAYFKMPKRPAHDVHPARDGCGLIWIAPVVPNRPSDIEAVLALGQRRYAAHGFEFHVAIIFHNARSAVVLMSIFFHKDDVEERRRAEDLHVEMVRELHDLNYQEYRTSIAQMDRLYASSTAYREFLATLKRAIDPDNIISPSRYNVG